MLKKSQNKFKKLFKGAVFGMACMLSVSSLPITAALGTLTAAGATDPAGVAISKDNSASITLEGAAKTATKGVPYKIAKATFTKGEQTGEVTKGGTIGQDAFSTSITVKYKNTQLDFDTTNGDEGLTFTPTMVGTYTVTYSVASESGEEYSYDYDIVCSVGQASFEFAENDKNILPSVYDPAIFEAKNVTPADVVLPMPKLLNAEGEEWKNGEETVKFYKEKQAGNTDHVVIQVDDSIKDALEVDTASGTAKLNGEKLVAAGDGNHIITFIYYQNGVFVSSTTREFDVTKNYYKNSNDAAGYELSASFATSAPDKASTGVAVNLPFVNATTSSTDKPANEAVNVHFDIKVFKRGANGGYTEPVNEDAIDTDKNIFTAPEDGDYRFEYTITDFYGNTSKQSRVFFINGIKDDVEPTVFIYKASKNAVETDENDDKKYVSAREEIKNETVTKNIVIYAIGANDNAIKNGITLTREIRDSIGITRFSISDTLPKDGEEDNKVHYNDYNLIFNFDADRFLADNYAVAQDMKQAGEQDLAKYLKDNHYLIVTHDGTGTDPVTKAPLDLGDVETDPASPNFDEEALKAALLEKGFAYVPHIAEEYEFGTATYSLYYMAEDAAGNKNQPDYVSVSMTKDNEYVDSAVPTINFPTSLKTAYQPDETITFEAPRFSDTADDAVKGNVLYRYLDGSRQPITTVPGAQTLTLTVNELSAIVKDADKTGNERWFETKGEKTQQGFVALEKGADGQYSIDLANRTQVAKNASYVELFVYGTDDYGNMGFYQTVMRISGTGDERPIELVEVKESSKNQETFVQGGKIYLPTLVYSDDHVEYMTHTVEVYHVATKEVEGSSEKVYTNMPSENSHAVAEKWNGTYTLDAGSFTASRANDYRAIVTVRDAANNSIATFFDFTATPNVEIEAPQVDNLSSETISLEVGKTYNLVPPTLSIDDQGDVGYAGYNPQDDSRNALYYSVSMVSAETNNYEQTQDFFRATRPGTYELKYDVYLIKYNKNEAATIKDGDLTFTSNGKTYRVLPAPQAEGGLVVKEADTVAADIASDSVYQALNPELYKLQTEVQKFNVTDTTAPTLSIDTSAYTTHSTVGGNIEIQRITATDNDDRGINPNTSYVEVKIERASGRTHTEPAIYMKDWDNAREGDDVYYDNATKTLRLNLRENGNYTITYYAFDYSGKSTSATYSFAVGDAIRPTVEIGDGFIVDKKDTYKPGDVISLNRDAITVGDNSVTGENKDEILQNLRDKITISVRNTTTNTTLTEVEGSADTFKLETAGTYRIYVSTTDAAGWTSNERYVEITIESNTPTDANKIYQTIGTILIVVSVVILLGVVAYFIFSKIKLDKEMKDSGKKKKSKSKK